MTEEQKEILIKIKELIELLLESDNVSTETVGFNLKKKK